MKRRRPLKPIDPTRLGQLASRPGIDPRVWVAFGRVTEVVWDAQAGGLVAVDIVGGPLDGETDVPASVSPRFGAKGALAWSPIAVGATVILSIPDGDANEDVQVIGVALGPETLPPAMVAGQSVADLFGSSHFLGAPDQQLNVELKQVRVVADMIRLVLADPQQAFVRGNAFTDALKTALDAADTFISTVYPLSTAADLACVAALAPLKPFFAGLSPALQQLKTDLATFKARLRAGDALSQHILGD